MPEVKKGGWKSVYINSPVLTRSLRGGVADGKVALCEFVNKSGYAQGFVPGSLVSKFEYDHFFNVFGWIEIQTRGVFCT